MGCWSLREAIFDACGVHAEHGSRSLQQRSLKTNRRDRDEERETKNNADCPPPSSSGASRF